MKMAIQKIKIIDANKVRLIEYLSLPKALRPMSLKRFAIEKLGVSEPTLHAWKRDPEIQTYVRNNIHQTFINDIPDVLLSLKNSAVAGDVQAARLFLDYVVGNSDTKNNEQREEITTEEAKKEIEILVKRYYKD